MSERQIDYGEWERRWAARVEARQRLARCLNARDVLDESAISVEECDNGEFAENVLEIEGLE